MAQRLGSWQMGQRVGSVLSIYNFVLEEMTGIYTNAPGLIAQDFNLRQLCKKGGLPSKLSFAQFMSFHFLVYLPSNNSFLRNSSAGLKQGFLLQKNIET
ncbi:MAG: hypothetical protein ACKO5X_03820 [Limnohabitans sp.]